MAELLIPGPGGCIIDHDAKEKFWGTLPNTTIMSANPEVLSADDGADVFFFDAEAAYLKTLQEANIPIVWKMIAIYLANHFQKKNDCTSHGLGGAMEDLEFVDIQWRGKAAEFIPIATEPLYGGGIVEIMGRRGDNGAYTSAPINYAKKRGFLARKVYGNIDLSVYDGEKAAQWCRTGVPQALLDAQDDHLLKEVIPVHSFEEGSALMRQGFTVVGGSNQGFSLQRDVNGFCRPQGSWAHCTRFRGRRGGGRPAWAYGQSWGPGSPSGNSKVTLDSGRVLDLPEGTFFVDPDTVNRMIRQGEFYALSSLDGFPVLDYKLWN